MPVSIFSPPCICTTAARVTLARLIDWNICVDMGSFLVSRNTEPMNSCSDVCPPDGARMLTSKERMRPYALPSAQHSRLSSRVMVHLMV